MVDEDEFEENSVKFQYPAELKERARIELEELKRKVTSREFPFNSEAIKLLQNVRYVIGRTHEGLPFPNDYFDVAYTKKGPTSWYQEGNRVVRPGGSLILFHPVDGNGKGSELGEYFPGLFPPPSKGTPVLDVIMERLAKSGLIDIQFRHIQETVWIPSPEDVLIMKCFGQSEEYTQYVNEMCFDKIVTNFEKHATEKGIKITHFYCLIWAKATET